MKTNDTAVLNNIFDIYSNQLCVIYAVLEELKCSTRTAFSGPILSGL